MFPDMISMNSMRTECFPAWTPENERSDLIRRVIKRLEDTNDVFNEILSGISRVDEIESQMKQITWCVDVLKDLRS